MEVYLNMEESVVSAVKDFAISINSSRNVVADMTALINATSCLPLSNFDYWERLIRSEFSSAMESSVQPKWKIWLNSAPFLTWVDLCNWDGYKREKALRTLSSGAPNSFFFTLILRRLNDWVPEVRKAARETLPQIAKLTDPIHVAESLCLVLSNWNSWGRIEATDKVALFDIISQEEIVNAIKSKIICDVSGPLTTILAQIGRTPVLDNSLSEIAKDSIQPAVRAKAYRSQFEGKVTWFEGRKWKWTDIRYCEGRMIPIISERELSLSFDFLNVLKCASVDRSSIVRRVAAEMLIKELNNLGDDSLKLANTFSSDSSSTVSERGKFALKKLKEKQV